MKVEFRLPLLLIKMVTIKVSKAFANPLRIQVPQDYIRGYYPGSKNILIEKIISILAFLDFWSSCDFFRVVNIQSGPDKNKVEVRELSKLSLIKLQLVRTISTTL